MPQKIQFPKSVPDSTRIRSVGQLRAPFEDVYHFVLSARWSVFFSLILALYLLINAIFAGLYLLQPGSFVGAPNHSFAYAFFFSVQTMATIGYGGIAPGTMYGHTLVTMEALIGLMLVAILTGMTFAKFARPSARVLYASKAVIRKRNGVPTLMMRLSNWRHNQIFEAQIRVALIVDETTREGDQMRRFYDLKLERDRSALFLLTWTVMHCIDESSPFYGDSAWERLTRQNAELLLTLTGIDEAYAATVHSRHRYLLADIVRNARYADIITVDENNTRTIDYHQFHEVIHEEE